MKRFAKWFLMFSILIVIFICFPVLVHAQIDPCTDPDLPCPIDGGLSALLVIGVGYGIKKVRAVKKSES